MLNDFIGYENNYYSDSYSEFDKISNTDNSEEIYLWFKPQNDNFGIESWSTDEALFKIEDPFLFEPKPDLLQNLKNEIHINNIENTNKSPDNKEKDKFMVHSDLNLIVNKSNLNLEKRKNQFDATFKKFINYLVKYIMKIIKQNLNYLGPQYELRKLHPQFKKKVNLEFFTPYISMKISEIFTTHFPLDYNDKHIKNLDSNKILFKMILSLDNNKELKYFVSKTLEDVTNEYLSNQFKFDRLKIEKEQCDTICKDEMCLKKCSKELYMEKFVSSILGVEGDVKFPGFINYYKYTKENKKHKKENSDKKKLSKKVEFVVLKSDN